MRVDLIYTIRTGEDPENVPAPTNIIVDNVSDTLDWTNADGHTSTQHEYCIDYASGKTWRPVTVKPIVIGNVTLKAEDIAIRLKAISPDPASEVLLSSTGFTSTAVPDANFFTLTTMEEMASHVFYAKGALASDGMEADKGESIETIPDLKGDRHLVYNGVAEPVLTGRPPIYDDRELGAIWFDNEAESYFAKDISPDIPAPVEVSLTMVSQPGTAWEAWMNNNQGIYVGDTGGGLRIIAASNGSIAGSEAPTKLEIGNIHIRFGDETSEVWVNGISQGSISNPQLPILSAITVGVHTNNAQWEFIARHDFTGELTLSQRNQLFSELSEKFQWGRERQMPFIKDGTITKSGTTLTANYTYYNPLGLAEDTSKTIYRWVALNNGLTAPIIKDGFGKTIDLSQFPSDITQVKFEAQVFDIHGNTWKRIASNWFTSV